jgi:hypothetical protein
LNGRRVNPDWGWHNPRTYNRIQYGPETAELDTGGSRDMATVKQFAQDVGTLITYMTATTTLSAPLGAALAVSQNSQASGAVEGSSSGSASGEYSTILSIGSGSMEANSSSQLSGQYQATSEAAAFRFASMVDDLHTRLAGATVEGGTQSTVTAKSTLSYFQPNGKPIEYNRGTTTQVQGTRTAGTEENQPNHIWIPTGGLDVFGRGFMDSNSPFNVDSLK